MVVLSRIIVKKYEKPKGSQNITSFQVKDTYFHKILMKIGFILSNNPGIRRFQEGKPPEKKRLITRFNDFRRILLKSKRFTKC